ncbi:hypothetical protein PYW08_014288 [Mythimna loreyi]|uniref:Uncharacterized protein n=1 Tax=Mythimna loreyi TaxID=667449 RepID=A0ACC2R8A4_9NEOP|nr:hypothetical protein PYW08_014288 [Mythimna loreyi]
MRNGWTSVISNIGGGGVNTVNCLYKTWGRIAPACTMDLYSLDKFKKYKKDWNYPVQVRHQGHVAVPEKEKPRCTTFQLAMKVTLTVGQYFGLCPVQGIHANDASKLRFKYLSWRCVFTYLSMTGQFTLAFVLMLSLFRETSSTVDTATSLIFYSLAFTTTTLFLRIAKKWPKLSMLISKVESVDPTADLKLPRNCNICCIGVLSLAIIEHILSDLQGISLTLDCEPGSPVYETFMKRGFTWLFIYFPYNTFYGILFQYINLQCAFNWNFTDVFVICMSMYLTSRLNQVNQRIIAAKDKNSPSSFWRTMREDYNRSVHLVRQVDKIIGSVVFISFASNLFFVCSQLLHTLAGGIKATHKCRPDSNEDHRLLGGYAHSIYFVFSFVFLVFRSLAVSLIAAKVHAASLEPAHSLYDISSANYCVEVERFLAQIHGDTVALTGLQFFQVKRGLVLTIAGTIVTYELVLMQFTGVSPASQET